MLAIRLQRGGRKAYATYRIVVQDSHRHPSSGRVVEFLGSYNPHTKEVILKKDIAQKFLDNGAQPSSRVALILKAEGVKLPTWVKLPETDKKKAIRNAEKLRRNQPAEEIVEEPAEAEAPTETVETKATEPTEEAA